MVIEIKESALLSDIRKLRDWFPVLRDGGIMRARFERVVEAAIIRGDVKGALDRGVYLGSWGDRDDVETDFGVAIHHEILLASYDQEAYEGSCLVITRLDGKLYESHGSHCSCNDLEGQWQPEETTLQALAHRLENATIGMFGEFGEARDEMLKLVLRLVAERAEEKS